MSLSAKLLELQELEFVLDESRILHRDATEAHAADVAGKIERLRNGIAADLLRRFDRLRTQGLAVSRVESGVCEACRLNIPQGELIRMRKAEDVPSCPNCGRFLHVAQRGGETSG
jgi:hypothetical protein